MAENRTHIPLFVERIINKIRLLRIQTELRKRVLSKAAVCIQKHIRGYLTRRHLKYLNGCATIIQRYFRGYKTRKVVAVVAKFKYDDMVEKYYNSRATSIQALWRGYLARKKFNYYQFKKWINTTLEKNKNVSNQMKSFKFEELARKEKEMIQDYSAWIEHMGTKLHHLLRTEVKPGIYSRKGTNQLSEIETYLKKFEYAKFMEDIKDERVKVALDDILKHDSKFEKETCARNKIIKKCLKTYKGQHTISNPAL